MQKFLRSAAYPTQWIGLVMIHCLKAVKRMGMLGVSARNMTALNVEVERVTLIGTGRENLTCFV